MNYYHLDSTLSGHTDHSEKDLSIPLLSVRLDTILFLFNNTLLRLHTLGCMHEAAGSLGVEATKINFLALSLLLQFWAVCYFPGGWQD